MKTKKLELAKETVVTLQPEHLVHVVGGAWVNWTKGGKSCCIAGSCNARFAEGGEQ